MDEYEKIENLIQQLIAEIDNLKTQIKELRDVNSSIVEEYEILLRKYENEKI